MWEGEPRGTGVESQPGLQEIQPPETAGAGHLFTGVLFTVPKSETTRVSLGARKDAEYVVSLHSGTSRDPSCPGDDGGRVWAT